MRTFANLRLIREELNSSSACYKFIMKFILGKINFCEIIPLSQKITVRRGCRLLLWIEKLVYFR